MWGGRLGAIAGDMAVLSMRHRPFDVLLVAWFALCAFPSLVMEMYIVLGVDLAAATDPLGRAWYFYASSWDPIFLDTPLWLRVMCTIDAFVFGAFYPLLVYALVKGLNWIRIPALLYSAAIVYSTLVYFGVEVIGESGRADLLMVFVINLPYTVFPLALAWRMRMPEPFTAGEGSSSNGLGFTPG